MKHSIPLHSKGVNHNSWLNLFHAHLCYMHRMHEP
uniref:Uncharacterized protein n=1 Tax=Arundo donax TaxID=35708 RepID=A0A0A9A6L9_ARUDO